MYTPDSLAHIKHTLIFTTHDFLARDMEVLYQYPGVLTIISTKKQF